jgi:sugar phosphate isomerase/epimerase
LAFKTSGSPHDVHHGPLMDRRGFLAHTFAAGALALGSGAGPAGQTPAAPRRPLKIDIYGRHLLWARTPAEVAGAAREAGYDGVDLNVRPDGQGHVTPARVKQDLPPFVAGLRAHGIEVSAITPPIADADSPFAEDILATASSLGIRHYWWGTYRYQTGTPIQTQLDALKPRIAKLAALTARHGMTAMYHTYAGNAVGTPVWDLLSILKDHDPAVLGFHYDVGHMVREGANGLWATNLRAAGRYVTGVSVKDFVWTKSAEGRWRTEWAPLGEGLVPLDPMAGVLKEIGFSGPIENQPEYPDGLGGQTTLSIPRERFIAAIRRDQDVLRKALAGAGLL